MQALLDQADGRGRQVKDAWEVANDESLVVKADR